MKSLESSQEIFGKDPEMGKQLPQAKEKGLTGQKSIQKYRPQ